MIDFLLFKLRFIHDFAFADKQQTTIKLNNSAYIFLLFKLSGFDIHGLCIVMKNIIKKKTED